MSQHCILLPHIYVVAMAFHVAAWNLASEASPSTPIDEPLYKAMVEPSGEFRVNEPLQGEPLIRKYVDMNRVDAKQQENSMMQEDMSVKKEENVIESNAITGKAMHTDDLEDLEEGSWPWDEGGKGKGKGDGDDDEEPDNEGDEDVEEDDNDGEDQDDDKQEKQDRYCKGVKKGCTADTMTFVANNMGANTKGNYDCCKEFGCRRRRRGGSCNARRRLTGRFPTNRRRIKKNYKDPGCSAQWFVKDGKKCSEKDPATRTVNNAKKKVTSTFNSAKKKIGKAFR